MPLAGHAWTVVPSVFGGWRAPRIASTAWETLVPDPAQGTVRVTGLLSRTGEDGALLLVHGLGGDPSRPYLAHAAAAAARAGLASLRLGLRGSDRGGEDLYHAALTDDLAAALASPELARYRDLYVLGFSLGGHIALRLALAPPDSRVRAVAAVCPPLDLDRAAVAIDRTRALPYRRSVLGALVSGYGAVAARRPVPTPWEIVQRVRTLRDWDRHAVVPRFGFGTPERYYAEASVGPRLGELACPALLVASEADPMVPAHTLRPLLSGRTPALDVRWTDRGGHVGFPGDLDLGLPGPAGLAGQAIGWLLAQRPSR